MLSLAGRIVSRSRPIATLSTDTLYNPARKVAWKTLEPILIMNSHNPPMGARCMSSYNPEPPPQVNSPGDKQASDSSWEGTTLDAGPTFQDTDFGTSWVDTVANPDTVVTAAATLQDLGLGSYTPVGLLQIALDSMHSAGLPWWASIVATTVVLRVVTFPLMLRAQRATPEYFATISSLKQASERTDEIIQNMKGNMKSLSRDEVQKTAEEIEKTILHFRTECFRTSKNMFSPMFIQGPIFLSFFLALNRMAEAPIVSMQTGGMLWFPDLTVPDPFYVLPAIACTTLAVIVRVGGDGAPNTENVPGMHVLVRVLPLIIFPFIMNYPAATLCYWSTTNFLSLAQTFVLKDPKIRKKLDLPPLSAMKFTALEITKVPKK